MKEEKIKRIAQERIESRQEYNTRRIKQLAERDGDNIIAPARTLGLIHNDFAPFFEHICKRLSD